MPRLYLLLALSLSITGCQTTETLREATDSVTNSVVGFFSGFGSSKDGNSDSSTTDQPVSAAAPTASPPKTQPVIIRQDVITQIDILDGDTLIVEGHRVRLFGIDAPEIQQTCPIGDYELPCGAMSRNTLIGISSGQSVACVRKDIDRYGREVSICKIGTIDINALMVKTGMAVAYRQYSSKYVPAEDYAKGLHRGVWRSSFVMPWDWRQGRR